MVRVFVARLRNLGDALVSRRAYKYVRRVNIAAKHFYTRFSISLDRC